MIFQFFCSLFVVTRYDVDGCLNLGPFEIGYHVHLVEHSTRVGVLLFAQSRTQSLQAFWSAGQRREDSGDIEKIQFF